MTRDQQRKALQFLAGRLTLKDNDDLLDSLRRRAKERGWQLTDRELNSLVHEAFQLRVAQKLRQLNARIDSLHPD